MNGIPKIVVLPCPFCGFDDVEIDEIDVGVHAVTCPDCGTTGPHPDGDSASGIQAIDHWNRAPRLDPRLAEIMRKARDSECNAHGAATA